MKQSDLKSGDSDNLNLINLNCFSRGCYLTDDMRCLSDPS